MAKKQKKKVCFAASSGGHYEQLMMLKPLMLENDSFILTEKTGYDAEVPGVRSYYVHQVNRREKKFIFLMILNLFRSIRIFLKERPDAIICTGVLATIPMCLLCKLFRRKLIYIESFAVIETPTLTGKLLYKFADQFYVQWESLLKFYPKALYLGAIY